MPEKPTLCQPCIELRMKWLDSRPSWVLPTFGIAHGSGAAYDASLAGLRDRSGSRHQQWSRLVREQMDLIARSCRAAGHISPEPVPAVVQVDLPDSFELAAGGDS